MPKINKKKGTTTLYCPDCTKPLQSARSLSLHLYHSPTCGNTCFQNNIDSSKPQWVNHKVVADLDDNNVDEDSVLENNDDEAFNDNGSANDTSTQQDHVPFELTQATLKSLLCETHVVAHSAEQRVNVELLHLLEKAEAPDYLFKDIIDWAARAKSRSYNFATQMTSRNAVLNDLREHFNMNNLRPTISELKLEAIQARVPIVSFDFQTMLVSLLTNTTLMQPENLVLNNAHFRSDGTISDVTPWFSPYLAPPDSKIDEVLSGQWYKNTVAGIDYPNCFTCPIIFYVDKTFIDPMRSRFNLEPLNFTLGIFNRSCRTLFDFWRTLGYISESPPSDLKNPHPGYKARNYHLMLEFLLKDLIALHKNPIILDNFHLRIGSYVKIVNLRIPVAFIIADTQGADKLCGRYLNYGDKIQRLHRSCKCRPNDATDTQNKCEWVDHDEMMKIIERGDKEELALYSQQHIPNHAFMHIDFGANRHGVFGATPNDVLHGIKLGIIQYILEIFLQDDMNNASTVFFDKALKDTLPHLKQGGNRQFPRLYFPNGISSLANTTADECLGILFISYLLCVTTQGRNALSHCDKMSVARINNFVKIFERILILHTWMSNSDNFWKLDDIRSKKRASKCIEKLIDDICEQFTRTSNQGWNISKLHELMHMTYLINQFGSPMNYDSGPCERMHQDVAKKPGRKAQKRHTTFTLQAANRLTDRHVIDHAYYQLIVRPEEMNANKTAPSYGSNFYLNISQTVDTNESTSYEVTVRGMKTLASAQDLEALLYPDLVEYIVAYFAASADDMPTSIRCCSEFIDETETVFRSHHNFRGSGFWHDWAWASYATDTTDQGFQNVPTKILCFLPDGVPGNNSWHAVCHPCQWRKKKETDLINQWTLQSCAQATINEIPYDIIPASSLFSHCLVVPDLVQPGVVYEVMDKSLWSSRFY